MSPTKYGGINGVEAMLVPSLGEVIHAINHTQAGISLSSIMLANELNGMMPGAPSAHQQGSLHQIQLDEPCSSCLLRHGMQQSDCLCAPKRYKALFIW
jgi:hypothetical protein